MFLFLFKVGRVFKYGGGVYGYECLLQLFEFEFLGRWKSLKFTFMVFFMVNLGYIFREQLVVSLQRQQGVFVGGQLENYSVILSFGIFSKGGLGRVYNGGSQFLGLGFWEFRGDILGLQQEVVVRSFVQQMRLYFRDLGRYSWRQEENGRGDKWL